MLNEENLNVDNNFSDEESSSDPVMSESGKRLKAYIERVERLEEDKKNLMEDIKEVFAEAKSDGFDIKAVRKIISLRKKDSDERAEEDAILETYMASIGML